MDLARHSLRPIVSSRRSITYGIVGELARILKPLVEYSIHHAHDTQEFMGQIKNIKLNRREYITSYDVTALFTSVPGGPTIQIINNKLEKDTQL